MTEKVGSLEIDQDLEFTRRAWAVKRAGWAVMALVILGALLGLFGTMGPLSEARAGEPGGPLWVEHLRFSRYLAPMPLSVHVAPGVAREGTVRVSVSRDLVAHADALGIAPEPDSVEAGGDELIYVFAVSDPSRPVDVDFNLRLLSIGPLAGRIGLDGGRQVDFTIFVYP